MKIKSDLYIYIDDIKPIGWIQNQNNTEKELMFIVFGRSTPIEVKLRYVKKDKWEEGMAHFGVTEILDLRDFSQDVTTK